MLFKCDWYDMERRIKVNKYSLVEVRHNPCLFTNEPFILAQLVQQVYYTTYPKKRGKDMIDGLFIKLEQGVHMIYQL